MPASQPFSWLTRRSFAESSTRYPTSPCSPGIRPVVKLAMAAAVVDGVTVRMTSRRAIREDRNRAWPARAWMFDAPRPSTSTTTAPDAAGSPKSFGLAHEAGDRTAEHPGKPRSGDGGHR